MQKGLVIIAVVLFTVVLSGCTEILHPEREKFFGSWSLWWCIENSPVKQLTPAEAYKLIDITCPCNMRIIDVRSPDSYAEGHIPDAINIPYYDDFIFKNNVTYLISHNVIRLAYVYIMCCERGQTSNNAAKVMLEYNFANVFNLAGGMDRWVADGFLVDVI